MRPAGSTAGSATADYLGAVAAVGLTMLALVAVREHQPQRRPPLDPVARIGSIVKPAPVVRPPRARPVRPRPSRPRRPPLPRPTVLAPVWAIGW